MRRRVADYEELVVYKAAFTLQQDIFTVSREWPSIEKYALIDQIRRASRAIGGNIAEAWAKRRYEAHFVSKLTDADGEQNETRHWLRTAFQCGYLPEAQHADLEERCRRVGAMLGKMMAESGKWTGRDGGTVGR